MARTKEIDSIEREALKIGYNTLLARVLKELEGETALKAVYEHQKRDLTKRLKELEGSQ